MNIEISEEVYLRYKTFLYARFHAEDVGAYLHGLIEMELRRYAAPGYNVDRLTGCKTAFQLENDICEFTRGANWKDHDTFVLHYLCLDVSNMKTINDIHGLPAGDDVLKGVAAAVRLAYGDRPLYRTGGDHFVVNMGEHLFAEVKAPGGVVLKWAKVSIAGRKNSQEREFVDFAIGFHIKEGLVKAVPEGAKLKFNYAS